MFSLKSFPSKTPNTKLQITKQYNTCFVNIIFPLYNSYGIKVIIFFHSTLKISSHFPCPFSFSLFNVRLSLSVVPLLGTEIGCDNI